MDEERELYAVKYTFAPLLEENPQESIVYIGGFNPEHARQTFGSELEEINRKYFMHYNFKIKEVKVVCSGTDKISLQPLEQKVNS